MLYNSGVNSIIADITFWTQADTTRYATDPDRTRNCNLGLDTMAAIVMEADGKWKWDDTNHTDQPIGTTTPAFVVSQTGNVGIGTTTPAMELVVNSASGSSTISVYSGSATLGGCVEIEGADGTWAHFITNASAISSIAGRCE